MEIPEHPVPWDGGNPHTLMQIEPAGPDRWFNPYSRIRGDRHLYGGQVMGQALAAAMRSAEDREVHSLHGYFLRAGDGSRPVTYEVERTRDGRNFSARRVVAHQGGGAIFHMECSFRLPVHQAPEHQVAMPDVPMPEELQSLEEYAAATGDPLAVRICEQIGQNNPIDLKPTTSGWVGAKEALPRQMLWMKIQGGETVRDPALASQLLAYLSDYWFSGVSLAVHGPEVRRGQGVRVTSLDHAMWFHNPAEVNDWVLYEADSPISRRGTSLARGSIWRRDGLLLASTAQEALLRIPLE